MPNLEILPTLADNYTYLLWQDSEACALDAGEAGPVLAAVRRNRLALRWVLSTHGHADHSGGNRELKKQTNCEFPGEKSGQDNTLNLGNLALGVLATPGHTRDSVCYYLSGSPGMLFTGDTLFVGGCGRLFEGSAQDLWDSFQKLLRLPEETLIYCGHEYTLENYAFARSVEPGNPVLPERIAWAEQQTRAGRPTVPSTLALEKQTNPFLRAGSAKELGRLREIKNHFTF